MPSVALAKAGWSPSAIALAAVDACSSAVSILVVFPALWRIQLHRISSFLHLCALACCRVHPRAAKPKNLNWRTNRK